MPRLMLSDEHWLKLKPIMLRTGVYDKRELRSTVEGILYRLRVGCPWRDLPDHFGNWNTVYRRFNEWSSKGKLLKIFENLVENPDLEWEFIDGSYVRAHQHSAGAAIGREAAIGNSRGGNTTKIHLGTDSFGLPIKFEITGRQVHDSKVAPDLIRKGEAAEYYIADKGYDSEALRVQVRGRNAIPIIPKRRSTKGLNKDFDKEIYKLRHLVENAFARLKHFRAVATRYDKLKRNFEGTVALACAFVWLPL